MIKKDFIQRYVDELAKVMAAVLQLKNNLKLVEAEAKLQDFSTDYLGIDLKEIVNIAPELVVTHLLSNKAFTLIHFKLLEELLYEKYLLHPTDESLKKVTLILLEYTATTDPDYAVKRMERIKILS